MKTGAQLIADERRRQIDKEGFDSEHDDQHDRGEIANAAAVYAMSDRKRQENITIGGAVHTTIEDWIWPWDVDDFKPTPGNRIHDLAKAGALIAAEIDRLQRKSGAK